MSSYEVKPPGLRNSCQKLTSRHSEVNLIHYKDSIKPQTCGEEIWCQVHYRF